MPRIVDSAAEMCGANTDRELWRKGDGDGNGMSYYEPSIHVTEQGGIGINVGGTVFVKPVEEWHRLAREDAACGTGMAIKAQVTLIPEFLRENDDLWIAWRRCQGNGGEECSWWKTRGWRITTSQEDQSPIMRLEIRFDPSNG